MDPTSVRPRTVVLALLCVAVVALGASTLGATTDPSPGLGLGSPGEGEEGASPSTETPEATDSGGDSERPSILDLQGERGALLQFCQTWLRGLTAQLALLAGLAGVFALLRWRFDAMIGAVGVVLVAYPGLFVYIALASCGNRSLLPDIGPTDGPSEEGGGLVGGPGGVTSPSLPTQILLFAVLATFVLVALLVLTGDHDQTRSESGGGDDVEEEASGAASVAAIGAAAGRAADRIEDAEDDADFENEVYRAWAEMTDPLSVDSPAASTPGEFANAAAAAGMDPADVDRLTDLFERVRYGGASPTPERERAAVETLRRIEATYAGERP